MYSLDLNVQTALDRRAELIHAVQNDTATHAAEPAGQARPSIWPALVAAVVVAIGLGWLLR